MAQHPAPIFHQLSLSFHHLDLMPTFYPHTRTQRTRTHMNALRSAASTPTVFLSHPSCCARSLYSKTRMAISALHFFGFDVTLPFHQASLSFFFLNASTCLVSPLVAFFMDEWNLLALFSSRAYETISFISQASAICISVFVVAVYCSAPTPALSLDAVHRPGLNIYRHVAGTGQERGSVVTLITTGAGTPASLLFTEIVPWYTRTTLLFFVSCSPSIWVTELA
jgi:hypothetical protein